MHFSRHQLKSWNSNSVRKYVVAVVFLETISESLGDPHTSHQVQETEARVTNLLFIVTTVPGVYTAHSILWSPRMLWSFPLKQMEKLRHTGPPTQSSQRAKSRSHLTPWLSPIPLSTPNPDSSDSPGRVSRHWASRRGGHYQYPWYEGWIIWIAAQEAGRWVGPQLRL